jgi:UDP-2,4-diacetamido-2,4,6-trideoxy-beta-L-altropyranose hydrolase
MRCLTLADALKASGAECVFICREHKGNLIEEIRQRGYLVKRLPGDTSQINLGASKDNGKSAYYAWLGSDWSVDANQTKLGLGESKFDWLIVDHYAIDARWEHALRSKCRKLMVIDDLADRQHDCDLLLDQNLGRTTSEYSSLVPSGCEIIVGPRYALLRPEFAKLRDYSLRRRTSSKLENLLITMGGIDQGNATGKILEALQGCSLPENCEITVIMGSNAPWLKEVKLLAMQMEWPTKVSVNVRNMAELMSNSDLAIGAAGSTSWERCCLGLPTLILVLANNQIKVADALMKNDCALALGSLDGISKNLRPLLLMVTRNKELYRMTQSSRIIADGQGVDRIKYMLLNNHV